MVAELAAIGSGVVAGSGRPVAVVAAADVELDGDQWTALGYQELIGSVVGAV